VLCAGEDAEDILHDVHAAGVLHKHNPAAVRPSRFARTPSPGATREVRRIVENHFRFFLEF
jgi:hypothetical protein